MKKEKMSIKREDITKLTSDFNEYFHGNVFENLN
jgi:hypothetical protein